MSAEMQRQIKEGVLRPEKGPSGPAPVAATRVIDPSTGKPLEPSPNGSPPAQAMENE